ncbi:hypothetical protein AVEN_107693-1, partial [Araneus ventricosus]
EESDSKESRHGFDPIERCEIVMAACRPSSFHGHTLLTAGHLGPNGHVRNECPTANYQGN